MLKYVCSLCTQKIITVSTTLDQYDVKRKI